VYFSAIQKIGEQALQSSTSQILGEVTVSPQASANCLSSGPFSWVLLFYFCYSVFPDRVPLSV
jgi:hypothetical protein